MSPSSLVRPLKLEDLAAADAIFRRAFGTFLGLSDPMAFTGDAQVVRSRFSAFPDGAFGAFVGDRLVGSVFASRWGRFGFFGPLTVAPEHWGQGIAQRLMEPVMARFRDWDVRLAGLFTFPSSSMHLALYQRFGFRPRFLTAILEKGVHAEVGLAPEILAETGSSEREALLEGCRRVCHEVYAGLDLTEEILHLERHGLGDLVVIRDGNGAPGGFALAHIGKGSEAGTGMCYVKFAAVLPGPEAPGRFERLLAAVEGLGSQRGVERLAAGVSTARSQAYEAMLRLGFRVQLTGVAMHTPNEEGFSHPGAWVLDDWR